MTINIPAAIRVIESDASWTPAQRTALTRILNELVKPIVDDERTSNFLSPPKSASHAGLKGPDPVDWTPRRGDVWESSEWGEATVLEEKDDGVMLLLKIRGAKSFTRSQFQESWTRVSQGAENPNVREIVGTDAEVAKAVAGEIRKASDG